MTPSQEKMNILKEHLSILEKTVTKAEFLAAFEGVRKFIADVETILVKKIDAKTAADAEAFATSLADLRQQIEQLMADLQAATNSTFAQIKQRSMESIDAMFNKMRLNEKFDVMLSEHQVHLAQMDAMMAKMPSPEELAKQAAALIPEDPEETPAEIRDKLETLEGEERLDASAVKNLPEFTKEIVTKAGWGAHPLTIQGLGITIDKNTRFINFTGSGLNSVTRSANGVVTVSLTAGAGSGTLVSEEVPTNTGDNINFTIAHTPDTGTLRVFRGGARQQSIGASPDFSLSGTTITLTTPLNAAQGEQIFVEYTWN